MREIVITSSVLITAVLCIRFLAKGKINPVLQYAFWLPVALRLMLPVPLWNSSFSILHVFPDSMSWEMDMGENSTAADRSGAADAAGIASAENMEIEKRASADSRSTSRTLADGVLADSESAGSISADQAVSTGSTAADSGDADTALTDKEAAADGESAGNAAAGSVPAASGFSLFMDKGRLPGSIFILIWVLGMIYTGGYMLFYQIRWKKYLRENRKALKGMETYRGKLSVYTVNGLPSPCLCGRNIYLTKEMAADKGQLTHILVHEYCHYKHLDFIWVMVRCVLTTVYWFHPLVWIAACASKQDGELACDEAAIHLLGEKERLAYGKTLLNLIVGENCKRVRTGIASTMSGGERGIRERILRISRKRKYVVTASAIAVLFAAAVIAVTFSGAARDGGKDADESMAGGAETMQSGEEGRDVLQESEAKLKELEKAKRDLEVLDVVMKNELEETALPEEDSVLAELATFDERIGRLGSRVGIADAKNPSDYRQAYYEEGESALDEDMYLLETRKGPDSSDIKIYGMYTRKFGLRGIKIVIGEDVNDYDEPWIIGMHNMEENIALYESAQDGMPRTFACKMAIENSGESEIWNLYLCDRYDTGTIEMHTLKAADLAEQIQERISFEIKAPESKIDVYDSGKLIGAIPLTASSASMEKIEEVVCGTASSAGFLLGSKEEEIRLIIGVGLKTDQTEEIWYSRLPFLSFQVECGSFGERNFRLGEAAIESDYVNARLQSRQSLDEWLQMADNILGEAFQSEEGHYDVMIQYSNPCPSYTRIADAFGERMNPVTQEKIMHNGIDLAAPAGSDVLAAADGTVYRSGYDAENGNYVVLYHALNGEFTYYTSCQEILVSEGESVTVGQKIATVGSTGRSTGAHLHFAVSRDGEYIEPVFE